MKILGLGTEDACDLLDEDHALVDSMFDEYQKLVDDKPSDAKARKQQLADDICEALKIHTTIEEEIFYPALKGKLGEPLVLNEALVEHDGAKDLIAKIQGSDAADPLLDARIKVLGEYVRHHVKEEQHEMFPKARAAKGADLVALRKKLEQRKAELMAAYA